MVFEENEGLDEARERNVRDALREDIGRGDWTSFLIPQDHRLNARVITRENAVQCGSAWFEGCIKALDPTAEVRWQGDDGASFVAGTEICQVSADARALLSAERSALNFLQMLSAVATSTRHYVDSISGLSPNPKGCVVLDTRKTLPGLRQAQKYAVRIGGGQNHRLALWDGILIKENHIAAAGGISAALKAAERLSTAVFIQVEVETLAELHEALSAGATNILLDNFSLEEMRDTFVVTAGRAWLEASGGIDLETVRKVAATGVDRISVGKITKDIRAVDLSMRVDSTRS